MRAFITYTDAKGADRVDVFLQSLPAKDRQKLEYLLQALTGVERLGQPYFKAFTGYPFAFGELILGDFRIFVHRLPGTAGEEKYLLVHGFRKKSQQTPTAEIRIATNRILQYYAEHI